MSILVKPYEISVWEDVLVDGQLTEKRLAIIGSDKMAAQCRAIEPTLTRNVNGTKKFSFKMYKTYIDNITGEKVDNPYSNWLVAERKVKLKYGTHIDDFGDERDTWYDFIIKDVVETSTNYLYSYQMEDALVQELSKNGFGVTLDEQLMNNIGDAKELGEKVLAETNWSVDSEVFIQTVDEALVYVQIPAGTKAKHILDQSDDNLNVGITIEDEDYEFVEASTVLAFYSCCKNKPHRFQFIYYDNGIANDDNDYGKNNDGTFKISRKDDRTISQANCQYYIDFTDPETDYVAPGTLIDGQSNGTEDLDLWLPVNFRIGYAGKMFNDLGTVVETDSTLSSWYRGKRYGFAQQSVYVPLLERYCSKYKRNGTIDLKKDKSIALHLEGDSNSITWSGFEKNGGKIKFTGTKNTSYSGIKFDVDYHSANTYILSYKLKVTSGSLKYIGGHNHSFATYMLIKHNGNTYTTTSDRYEFNSALGANSVIEVVAKYNKIVPDTADGSPYIFIQPNRGINTSVGFEISDLTLSLDENYLGYVDSEFTSPTLIQNFINNYNFESTSGWTASASIALSSAEKASVQNVYGRFEGEETNRKFVSITDDFYNANYSESRTYTPYMELSFSNADTFILNSGIRDNRTLIKNIQEGEEWVLDYKIVDKNEVNANSNFSWNLGEYIYNTSGHGYEERSGLINFTIGNATTFDNGVSRRIITVGSSGYTENTFKKNCKIYLKIVPPSDVSSANPGKWYIEKIALYKKAVDASGNIITPDYEEEQSKAAQEFVSTGIVERKYHYFNEWLVDSANPNVVVNKEDVPTVLSSELVYNTYAPVYNEGAKKVRSVSAKESNYFNILQSIAETFEAWLEFEITRNGITGAIEQKKVKFKNYIGKDNYVNFRYGLNLKDITRTSASKNIVTKLIVKQNSNQNAENGFCTIQRAGANPTGENYIYDFQYYQNMGIMNTEDYLNTVYYMDGAKGSDAVLWNDPTKVQNDTDFTLNGYYQRVKKINDTLLPINEELVGLNADLVQQKADLEIASTTYEASISGIEQTREDFLALTGVYPEEAQNGQIDSVSATVTPKEDWWAVDGGVTSKGTTVSFKIKLTEKQQELYFIPKAGQGVELKNTNSTKAYKFTTDTEWEGLYVDINWETGVEYILQYELEATSGTLKIIGGHDTFFETANNVTTIKETDGTIVSCEKINNDTSRYQRTGGAAFENNKKYIVTVRAKRRSIESNQSPYLWIQPNRSIVDPVECTISNIKLYKVITSSEAAVPYDRKANFYLNADASVNGKTVKRTYQLYCTVPAKALTASMEHVITAVDTSRSDVQKYITEYTTYYEKRESSSAQKDSLTIQVANKERLIKEKQLYRNTLLDYKRQLNQLFFQKYSRFILEGTWISEEYIDDDKYYADSQSVLYNSCYPQVSYAINVLSLAGIQGYELFVFELGDKTSIIDEEFFGEEGSVEVIITEMAEVLDDPSKNQIKVQNFKNQFQDLFQKITATVQQTQYNVGSYEKGAALMEANVTAQSAFITNAINSAATFLSPSKKHDVVWDDTGITVTDRSTPTNQVKLVGGAILLSMEDPNTKEQTWRTGITNEGISADLITAGRLDAGVIQIMSGDEPVFRWDAYGISAYDALWSGGEVPTISGINTRKFVRFDKNGIYGIDNSPGVDGASWHPQNIGEIEQKATFALTWEGLKVTGNEGVVAKLGREGNYIMKVTKNGETTPSFSIDLDGNVSVSGGLSVQEGATIAGWTVGANSLVTTGKTLGTNGFHMYTANYGTGAYFGASSSQNWALGIGQYFGVTSGGDLYAKNATLSGGNIAGWTIGTTSIKKGTLGTDGFHMYSSSYGAGAYFGAGTSKSWALGIGQYFGVTSSGDLYAKSGQIGGFVINSTTGALTFTPKTNDDGNTTYSFFKINDYAGNNKLSIVGNQIHFGLATFEGGGATLDLQEGSLHLYDGKSIDSDLTILPESNGAAWQINSYRTNRQNRTKIYMNGYVPFRITDSAITNLAPYYFYVITGISGKTINLSRMIISGADGGQNASGNNYSTYGVLDWEGTQYTLTATSIT